MSRISQETFNEAVEENIREFGMSREEAVADAVVQFEAQGVDLSNIVKDASEEGHPVLNAANTLKAFIEGAEGTSASAAAAALARVVAECAKDPSNRDVAGFNGIVRNAVFFANRVNLDLGAAGAAELEERLSHLKTAIEAVRALTFMHNENRNQVPVAFLDVLVDCTAPERPLELQRAAWSTAAVLCVKREEIKTYLWDRNITDVVQRNLREASGQAMLIRDTCLLLSRLLTDDDYSVMSSKAYEFAREVAKMGLASQLLAMAKLHKDNAIASAEVFSALRSICVNDEICREIEGMGGIETITACLAPHVAIGGSDPVKTRKVAPGGGSGSSGAGGSAPLGTIAEMDEGGDDEASSPAAAGAGGGDGSAGEAAAGASTPSAGAAESEGARRTRMVRCGFAVMRAVANSDPVKVKMCEGEAAPLSLLLQALDTFKGAPSVLEQVVATIGSLCLRLPDHAALIHARGAMQVLSAAMRRHPGHLGLQRALCLALRNIFTRSKERMAAAADEGFEALFQAAYMRHPACRDVAYACLRDMGCTYAETEIGRAQADRAARAIAAGDISVQ